MTEHVVVTDDGPVRCSCGRSWPDLSREQAIAAARVHPSVEKARAALHGEKEDANDG